MAAPTSTVRFSDQRGQLKAVEIQRTATRPLIQRAHAALLALGIVVTSYQVRPSKEGLNERLELAQSDGTDLDEHLSLTARSALLPLVLADE